MLGESTGVGSGFSAKGLQFTTVRFCRGVALQLENLDTGAAVTDCDTGRIELLLGENGMHIPGVCWWCRTTRPS